MALEPFFGNMVAVNASHRARQPMSVRNHTREVSAFFDLQAERYDHEYELDGAGPHVLKSRMDAAVRMLGPGPGEVLDIGMGPGRLCEQLTVRGWMVSGVDPSREMVDRARARIPQAAERMSVGRAEALEFPDQTFDAVVATGVLEYAADLPRVITEAVRVLRPGGRAVLSIPNPRALYALWKTRVIYPAAAVAGRTGVTRRPLRPAATRPVGGPEFERILSGAGLEVAAVEYTGFLVLPTPLENLLPTTTVRIARRLEDTGPVSGRRLATQMVFSARRGLGG